MLNYVIIYTIIIDMIKKIIIIGTALAILISLILVNCFAINTKQINTRQEVITTNKLKQDTNDIIVAYFSDLHYGNFIDKDFLDKTIQKINNYDPDVIIFGGDLIDKFKYSNISTDSKQYLIDALKSLKCDYGKYAVYGNHDTSFDNTCNEIKDVLSQADFKVLDNECASIYIDGNTINLVGINSLSYSNDSLQNCFSNIHNNDYTFAVTHFPDLYNELDNYTFDYMLAGHSHGGQVYIPIISLFNREFGCNDYYRGKHKKDNKTLDITSGVGRTRYNARLNADSEIVIYRLSPESLEEIH